MSEEYWNFYTRGEPGKTEVYEKVQSEILSDPKTFERLKAWNGKIQDPLLARRVDLLYRTFAMAQVTSQEKIYTLQNSLQRVQINFRSTYQGKPATQNQLTNVMRFEKNRALRKEAWLARNQVGKEMAPDLPSHPGAQRGRATSGTASTDGLSLGEIDETWLFQTLDELDRLSRIRTRQARSRSDARGSPEPWDTAYDYDNFRRSQEYFPGRDPAAPEGSLQRDRLRHRRNAHPGGRRERPGRASTPSRSPSTSPPTSASSPMPTTASPPTGPCSTRWGAGLFRLHRAAHDAAPGRRLRLLHRGSASFPDVPGRAAVLEPIKVPAPMVKEALKRLEDALRRALHLVMLNFEREAYRNPDQT
jgi:hypothetical protein